MLLTNPVYKGVTEDWFNPEWWGFRAQPVAAGGRGSAWFLDADQGDMVLRHYRRGGLAARLSERSYLYTGWGRTRAVREFGLLEQLYGRGLPVPEPVAARAVLHGLFYRAAIIIRRIPAAAPWPDASRRLEGELWRSIGAMIRQFHEAGLDHVDLNCDNILVTSAAVYLIDFDRCRMLPPDTTARWRSGNLSRLKRSVDKRFSDLADSDRERLWKSLEQGYARL